MGTGGNTSPYTYLTFHIHAINLSIKSQQGKRWAFASHCAKQPCSEGCGTHQLFHQLLLSRKCIYNIIPVQLQPMYNGLLSMTNIVIKLYNLETNVHVRHLSLHCSKLELAPQSWWLEETPVHIYICHPIINLSIESEKFQQGKSWACAAQCAKQPCSGGELYMWHTSTVSSTATATEVYLY